MSPNSSPNCSATVPAELQGERLDRVCTQLLANGLSRSQIGRRIREGLVTVDGTVIKRTGHKVNAEQCLELAPLVLPDTEHAADPLIIYQDEFLAVLDKPAGLRMHGNYVADPRQSVASFCAKKWGDALPTNQGAERPGIVHRLDRGTSGVCVVAFEQKCFLDLQQQFADRSVEKTYTAICYGTPRFQSEWIESRLMRDQKRPEKMRTTNSTGPDTRDAATYWEAVEKFDEFCLLNTKPRTGRMHQIRIHLASVKLPLVGDPLYSAKNYGVGMHPEGAPRPKRPLLHATTLCFEHPKTGEIMRFDSELPEVMKQFLASLRANKALEGTTE